MSVGSKRCAVLQQHSEANYLLRHPPSAPRRRRREGGRDRRHLHDRRLRGVRVLLDQQEQSSGERQRLTKHHPSAPALCPAPRRRPFRPRHRVHIHELVPHARLLRLSIEARGADVPPAVQDHGAKCCLGLDSEADRVAAPSLVASVGVLRHAGRLASSECREPGPILFSSQLVL